VVPILSSLPEPTYVTDNRLVFMNKRIKVEFFQPWQKIPPGNTCPLSPSFLLQKPK
jgi:hypothetical protein